MLFRCLPPTLLAALALLAATPLRADVRVTDDTGHEVHLAQPAKRIVSLAPHITELLFAAGAGDRVVGAVTYSNYPAAATHLPQVGASNNIDLEAIAALKPDLIVAWKSGNRDRHLDRLAALGIPIYLNEPRNLDDIGHSVQTFGRLAGSATDAEAAAAAFFARKTALQTKYSTQATVRTFYQIWNQPLMTINGEHFISRLIALCGGENVFAGQTQLAPTLGVEAVLAANPEAIVASGMDEARPEWLDQWRHWPQLAATASDNLFFIPPDLIQRPTPRILEGAALLCEQLDSARRKRPSH